MNECPNCGASETHIVPVWEERERAADGEQPDYIGCTNCHQMMRPHLLRDEDDETPPQAPLTDYETRRLKIGNQHSDALSIIEWRCVKGAAMHYGVTDWTSKVDSTLTQEENVTLMERRGTQNNKTTLRQMKTPRTNSDRA